MGKNKHKRKRTQNNSFKIQNKTRQIPGYNPIPKSTPPKQIKSVSDIDENIIIETYRLALSPCRPRGAHKNCSMNVNCLYGLGENKALPWVSHQSLVTHLTDQLGLNPADNIRNAQLHLAGLKNLGATCYMNSLIQCLYMNLRFRNGVYAWRGKEKNQEESVCYQLQLLFAHLQLGKSKFFSPNKLTELLNIKTCIQQDAQEFCNLFLSYLEERFATCKDSSVSSLIRDEFCGKYDDFVTCNTCHSVSRTNSTFHELVLHIQGQKTLYNSLNHFLAEDILTGSNQYACGNCNILQDATKNSILIELPPVLNIQLLRFVYDTKLGRKQKVMDNFEFPYILDLTKYVKSNRDSHRYELSAILLHLGSSAHGGHYIAHIRQQSSNQWYKFDDQNVTPLDIRDVGLEGTQKTEKKPSNNNSPHLITSSNAYMLIYTLHDHQATSSDYPPSEMVDLVTLDNLALGTQEDNYNQLLCKEKDRLAKIRNKYETLWKDVHVQYSDTEWNWISTEWLKSWISGSEITIDNYPLMCVHENADPRKISQMKRIRKGAWLQLKEWYGGGPELSNQNHCKECIFDTSLEKSFDSARQRSKVEMISESKRLNPEEPSYIVSKVWLEEWRKKCVNELPKNVNEYITCKHDNLQLDPNMNQTISAKLWTYLLSEFPESKEFPNETSPCEICQVEQSQQIEEVSNMRKDRFAEKNKFPEVYKKQIFNISNHPPGTYNLIPLDWARRWKQYINVVNNPPPGPIDNKEFLSIYGNLQYIPGEDHVFYLVSNQDWQGLCDLYSDSGPEIILEIFPEPIKNGDTEISWKTTPPISMEDVTKLRENQNFNFQDYISVVKRERAKKGPNHALRIKTSGETTLETFKLQIFENCSVAPVVQKLFYKDVALEDDSKSLAQFGIRARDTVVMSILDEDSVSVFDMHAIYSTAPEEGFKGSNLQGHFPEKDKSDGDEEESNGEEEEDDSENGENDADENGKNNGNGEVSRRDFYDDTAVEKSQYNIGKKDDFQSLQTCWVCPKCTFYNTNTAACDICGYICVPS